MIRGVSFKIQQSNIMSLWNILKCIDIKNYNWYNIQNQTEAWDTSRKKVFFNKSFYDGESFSKHIQNPHFILFLKLQAYFKNDVFSHIHTYEQFEKSDCQLLLLIYDCEFVELYLKDLTIATNLFQYALKQHYEDVEYIVAKDDKRTIMNVR